MNTNNIIPMHQIGFPINIENIISDSDSVRVLYDVMEGLDYSELNRTYSTIGRNPALLPKTMFAIIVYGYMEGIYSSRALEKACKRDINFKWLLQGQLPPGHNSIDRFRRERLAGCIENLFNQLVKKLRELNEIQFKNIFIDGTKIEASANRYTFVWKKSIDKFEDRLQKKIKESLIKMNHDLNLCLIITNAKISVQDANYILDSIRIMIEANNIEFVYGKGKRKSKFQRYTEQLNEFIEKQNKYNEYNSIFNGRNSFSKTDHDATFMHMKEDHMKNGQLKPAYNIQIGVEGEYIVGVDISSERSDQLTFIPFLDRLEKNLNQKYESVTADAGYESEENYAYLESKKQEAFIKPANYEKSKTKKFKSDISKKENMYYNTDEDYYICASGKKMLLKGTKKKKTKSGYETTVSIYECEDCDGCEYKSICTKAKGNKQIHVAKNFMRLRTNSLKNITTPKGILLRMNRSIQVEGAFGVIKQDYGFRRFFMRGNIKVRTEFLLMAFGYNVNKLYHKTIQNRNGELLHKQQAS
ncbi:IS1182 family transposase [Klebsiella pneumoniae]|uniref:IS1182-like element ISClbu1 family transposase n=1 Tax=Clostridium butyricum TaxID=1492 RepID=UPI00071B89EF|nr:IS1182-like element ISClbu1 family transposase [Clostridium butyricum]MBS2904457.1 IS1182 family transposase [Klebsiella pneumoniae]ALP91538.1 transposase [Clostridium butyricum]ALS17732.1 transposase [Clostridium butyricum]ALS18034.1 transposase [Clostridium butyricum]ALS18192.1 transposase [Clostridium butyricum]